MIITPLIQELRLHTGENSTEECESFSLEKARSVSLPSLTHHRHFSICKSLCRDPYHTKHCRDVDSTNRAREGGRGGISRDKRPL